MNKVYKNIRNGEPFKLGYSTPLSSEKNAVRELLPVRDEKTRVIPRGEMLDMLRVTEMIDREIAVWKEIVGRERGIENSRIDSERDRAYHEGHDQGFADGIEKERGDQIKGMAALFGEAKRKSEKAIEALEIKVVDLAVTIAESIIRKSIETEPAIVENIVADTMAHIIGSETVVLKVSPEDYKTINSKYDQWLNMAGSAGEFRIEIDKRLRVGDCIVETDGGIIDGVVTDRINLLVEKLLKINR